MATTDKKYIDFDSGSVTDNSIQLLADPTTGALSKISMRQQKDYFAISGSFVTASYDPTRLNAFTASILSFTASYFLDSASFNTRINSITGSALTGSFVTTSSFNTFSSSYHSDSSSFNTRINAITGSGGSGTGSATSFPKASDLGITTTGDQTAALNTIFSNSNYKGIVLDFVGGGAVSISGSVNCQGKTITFLPGSTFTNSGSLSNMVIDAGYKQKLFDVSIAITGSSTANSMFSANWYGAGLGGGDDQPALQKASSTIIGNSAMTRDLYLPGGNYPISRPWMIHNWNGTTYGQYTVNVIGDYKAANSNTTGFANILPNFYDGPAIGVQRATAGSIRGIIIQGLFTYNTDYATFVNTPFSSVAGSQRYSNSMRYSPTVGIAIDPVRQDNWTGSDGGYPLLNGSSGSINYYRGDGSNGGTTDFLIKDCSVQGFTVCIGFCLNGQTQQGEDCVVEDCKLNFCNIALSYGQSQTDNNFVRKCRSWSMVWTVIDSNTYGFSNGQPPNVDGYNVAGAVNTLFNITSQKAVNISNFYAESFFSIGTLQSPPSAIILQGCTFDFGDDRFQPQYHIQGTNTIFIGCRIRYYDDLWNKRIRLAPRNMTFQNCYFDLPPYSPNQDTSQQGYANYIDCTYGGSSSGVLSSGNMVFSMATSQISNVIFGNFKLQDGLIPNPITTYTYNCANMDRKFAPVANTNFGFVPDSNRSASFTTTVPNQLLRNDILVDYITGDVCGRVDAISASIVTVTSVPMNIVSGSRFNLRAIYFLTNQGSFIGDITNGSTNVTNITPVFPLGFTLGGIGPRLRYDHPAFPLGTYITSVSGSTVIMSQNANKTAVRQNFVNGNPLVEVEAYLPPTDSSYNTITTGFPTGTKWKELVNGSSNSVTNYTEWIFRKGGVLSSSVAATKAEVSIQPQMRLSGSSIQWYNTYTDTWTTVS